VLMEHAVNGGSGDAVLPCDLTEALSMLTVSTDRFAIEFKGRASDVPALEAGVYGDSHPQIPRPMAVGSRSQSGGVSQMNARIAMTQMS